MAGFRRIPDKDFYERRGLLFNKAMELDRLIDEGTSKAELKFVVSQIMALIAGVPVDDILMDKEQLDAYFTVKEEQ